MTTQHAFQLSRLSLTSACCTPNAHLSIKDLSIAYGNDVALRNVTLDIYRGCITALIGPSGCGKTSLLSTINRLIERRENIQLSGRVELDGENILSPAQDVTKLRRRIGMVFQRPTPFPLSIRRNIELPLKESGVNDARVLQRKTEAVLREVGLWEEVADRLDSSALTLSGGQQQRLCIARALALEPEMLLLDEPCSALDPLASAAIESLIKRLSGTLTTVIVTHNIAQAKRVANYIGFFWPRTDGSSLVEFNKATTLVEKPSHNLTAAFVSGLAG